MSNNFFDYMFSANQKPEKNVADAAPTKEETKTEQPIEAVAMDEGIGEWTHKFVVYCKNPKKEFEEELKSKDGVVAVFMKEKETAPAPTEANPPDNK